MTTTRRALIAAGCAAALAPPGPAAAQTAAAPAAWPSRPITLLIGFPPGTGADTVGRLYAERMSQSLGQRMVVDNRPGQGGSIALQALARSRPDGYTLAATGGAPLVINPHLYPNIGYDPVADVVPIGLASEVPYLLVAGRHLGVRDVAGLVALAKTRPVTYGSSGNGSTAHLLMALFAHAAGGRFEHVPYRGSAQSITDLLAGRIDVLFDTAVSLLPHWREGGVVALASGGARRPAIARDVPTVAEAGYPQAAAEGWHCIIGPAGLPDAAAARLREAMQAALGEAGFRERLTALGVEPPEDARAAALAERIRAEGATWREAIRLSGARID